MSKKHDDPRGKQKGAQQHAEGQHGEKARARFLEEINNDGEGSANQGQRAANDPHRGGSEAGIAEVHERELSAFGEHDGRHRLVEQREQSDEAEKNSEKTRLSRDIDRHGHDREQFQVPGGRENHPIHRGLDPLPDERNTSSDETR